MSTLMALSEKTDNDIRSCLNTLQVKVVLYFFETPPQQRLASFRFCVQVSAHSQQNTRCWGRLVCRMGRVWAITPGESVQKECYKHVIMIHYQASVVAQACTKSAHYIMTALLSYNNTSHSPVASHLVVSANITNQHLLQNFLPLDTVRGYRPDNPSLSPTCHLALCCYMCAPNEYLFMLPYFSTSFSNDVKSRTCRTEFLSEAVFQLPVPWLHAPDLHTNTSLQDAHGAMVYLALQMYCTITVYTDMLQ